MHSKGVGCRPVFFSPIIISGLKAKEKKKIPIQVSKLHRTVPNPLSRLCLISNSVNPVAAASHPCADPIPATLSSVPPSPPMNPTNTLLHRSSRQHRDGPRGTQQPRLAQFDSSKAACAPTTARRCSTTAVVVGDHPTRGDPLTTSGHHHHRRTTQMEDALHIAE